jgi:branched-chain amino acid transport system substrate-binding protein
VGKSTYSGTTTNFDAILDEIQAAKPDLVYMPEYDNLNLVGIVMGEANSRGMTVPFMGGDGWDWPDLDIDAVYDGYYTDYYDPDNTSAGQAKFVADYKKRYDNRVPNELAALAYDATNLLLTAIQNAGVDDTWKVQPALQSISFDGATGHITFDAEHNPIKPVVIMHVKDGEITFLTTVSL